MATRAAEILMLRSTEYEVPANEAQNTMNTIPTIMLRYSEITANPHRLSRMMPMFFRLKFRCTRSANRERTTVIRPIRNRRELTNKGKRPGPARLNWPIG
jgi:hypothetical protein